MNIALIAHDAKKKLMQNFCIAYRGILNKNELYATGTTGRLIEEVTNLNIHKFLAGHLGGEQQIGGRQQCGETVRYAQYPAGDQSGYRGAVDQIPGQRRP